MGSVKSNGWFVQLNKTTGGPYSLDEIRKLLDQGEIKPDSKVFSSRHPKEKITALELVKMRSDPAYGLFEILRRARHKRDSRRSKESEQESVRASEKTLAAEVHAEARLRRLIPFWVWAVSLSLILCGAVIWTLSRSRLAHVAQQNDRSTASTPASSSTPTAKQISPSFVPPPRPLAPARKAIEAPPMAEPARLYLDRDRERDERENEVGDPRVDPQNMQDLQDAQDALRRDPREMDQPLIENTEPPYSSEDPVRTE